MAIVRDFLPYFIEKSKEKGFDLSTIRKEMSAAGRPEEEIKSVVKAIDDILVERALDRNGPEWYRQLKATGGRLSGKALMIIGIGLIALSLVMTAISYIGYLANGEAFHIHFGPAVYGVFVALIGVARTTAEKRYEKQRQRRAPAERL